MSKKLNSIELTILNNILNIVNKHNVNLSKIAIAVSGGADSLFLAIVIKNILNNLCE